MRARYDATADILYLDEPGSTWKIGEDTLIWTEDGCFLRISLEGVVLRVAIRNAMARGHAHAMMMQSADLDRVFVNVVSDDTNLVVCLGIELSNGRPHRITTGVIAQEQRMFALIHNTKIEVSLPYINPVLDFTLDTSPDAPLIELIEPVSVTTKLSNVEEIEGEATID